MVELLWIGVLWIGGFVLACVAFCLWERYTARRDMRAAVRQIVESRQRIQRRLDRL